MSILCDFCNRPLTPDTTPVRETGFCTRRDCLKVRRRNARKPKKVADHPPELRVKDAMGRYVLPSCVSISRDELIRSHNVSAALVPTPAEIRAGDIDERPIVVRALVGDIVGQPRPPLEVLHPTGALSAGFEFVTPPELDDALDRDKLWSDDSDIDVPVVEEQKPKPVVVEKRNPRIVYPDLSRIFPTTTVEDVEQGRCSLRLICGFDRRRVSRFLRDEQFLALAPGDDPEMESIDPTPLMPTPAEIKFYKAFAASNLPAEKLIVEFGERSDCEVRALENRIVRRAFRAGLFRIGRPIDIESEDAFNAGTSYARELCDLLFAPYNPKGMHITHSPGGGEPFNEDDETPVASGTGPKEPDCAG